MATQGWVQTKIFKIQEVNKTWSLKTDYQAGEHVTWDRRQKAMSALTLEGGVGLPGWKGDGWARETSFTEQTTAPSFPLLCPQKRPRALATVGIPQEGNELMAVAHKNPLSHCQFSPRRCPISVNIPAPLCKTCLMLSTPNSPDSIYSVTWHLTMFPTPCPQEIGEKETKPSE